MSTLKKRTNFELRAAPLPDCPAELEVLSEWYFGKPLHLDKFHVYERDDGTASGSYRVAEEYNSYHGNKWLHSECCIHGYDYSRDFWGRVIGTLSCGGIASRSYGQFRTDGRRNIARLKRLQMHIRKNESGRLREAFVRLARSKGAGESLAIRDSQALTAGRVDGAAAVAEESA